MAAAVGEYTEVDLVAWSGERLKELRKLRGYQQDELAEMAGVNQSVLSRWERNIGRPDVYQVYDLADALRVSCEAFRQPVGQEPLRSRKIDDPADEWKGRPKKPAEPEVDGE